MIGREELKRTAERKGISLANSEKDYLLDVLLFSTYQAIGDSLVLKGGTSLFKLYSLNRFSDDLDFTLNSKRFDYRKFTEAILRYARLIGIHCVSSIEAHSRETNIFFSLRGPLYDGRKESISHISMNISHRERISLPYDSAFFIPGYKDIPSFTIFAMAQKEILAEKVRAAVTRNKPRDVYDLWFLLKRGIEVEYPLINDKLEIYDRQFGWDEFVDSMLLKERLWNNDLRGLVIGPLPNFLQVVGEIEKLMKKE